MQKKSKNSSTIIINQKIIGSISIASFATVIGKPLGIASASFSLAFSMSTGLLKKLLKIKRSKKKKHNKIDMFARSKSNSIKIKLSVAVINKEIVMKTL